MRKRSAKKYKKWHTPHMNKNNLKKDQRQMTVKYTLTHTHTHTHNSTHTVDWFMCATCS